MRALSPELEKQLANLPQTSECNRDTGETCKLDIETSKARTMANGYVIWSYFGCRLCAAEQYAERERQLIGRGVPVRLVHATLENFECQTPADNEALNAAKQFAETPRGFFFVLGDIGLGKSHLAVAVIRRFKKPRFIRQAQLLKMLRESYGNPGADPIELCASADMLALDEFGVSGGGKDEPSLLYEVFEQRFSALAPMVVTSNLSLPQIAEALGPRITDRVKEALFKCVVLTGPSRRQQFRADYFTAEKLNPKAEYEY